MQAYSSWEAVEDARAAEGSRLLKASRGKAGKAAAAAGGKKAGAKGKKKASASSDEDMEDVESDEDDDMEDADAYMPAKKPAPAAAKRPAIAPAVPKPAAPVAKPPAPAAKPAAAAKAAKPAALEPAPLGCEPTMSQEDGPSQEDPLAQGLAARLAGELGMHSCRGQQQQLSYITSTSTSTERQMGYWVSPTHVPGMVLTVIVNA